MPNPFFYGPRITDPRYFVGRKAELGRIFSALEMAETGQVQSVAVVGPRRIGKSSLLYHLTQVFGESLQNPADYRFVYTDLDTPRCQTQAGLLGWVLEQITAPVPILAQPEQALTPASFPILIVAVTRVEVQAILKAFSTEPQQARQMIGDKIYYALGIQGGAAIFMVQSEMGTATPGGALMTVHQAIQDLHPRAVILCGIAYGLRPDRQKPGDILIAKQIAYYEPQKVDIQHGQIPRGDRTTTSERLLDRFRSAELDWKGAPTHFGLVLSGEKLINDPDFRNWLIETEPEAIGGEMEGAGLYTAARNAKVDWILVKAVCDWADGKKDDAGQVFAANNAAQFVLHVLQLGAWNGQTPDRQIDPIAGQVPERLPANRVPLSSGPNLIEFAAALKRLRQSGGPCPVVCLDEFEHLTQRKAEFSDEFFTALRSLAQEGLMAIVTASKTSLVDLFAQGGLTSPFHNIFQQLELGNLAHAEANELLDRGRACDRPFTGSECAGMRRLAGENPYALQLAGSLLYQAKASPAPDWAKLKRDFDKQLDFATRRPSLWEQIMFWRHRK